MDDQFIALSKDSILFSIIELYQNYTNDLIKCHEDKIFVHINYIEELYDNLFNNRFYKDQLFVSKSIEKLNEKVIIKLIREKYLSLGIKLKTAHKIPLTMQTERVKITFSRYLLLPKSKDDGKLLNELEGKRGIFPLDIALGIDKLPHNMTVKAMLKVSKCAQAASSYKNASKTLADDHGIKLDPATIMTVTNHIGGLVFKNEMANAEECYNSLVTGKMTFPQRKKDAVLYIEMDGAFVNTREKSETANSTWHENKLGLVFSSESKHPIQSRAKNDSNLNTQNIYERKKYKLMQKNYTAYVGSVDEFKKLMFYCAVRSGYGSYKETVLISDGATWIRNLKEFLFWDAQQILDYYHLSEKVWAFGRQYFKITTSNNNYKKYNDLEKEIINHPNYSEYKVWGDKICDKILNSRIDEVFTDISNKEQHLNAKNGKLSKYILNNKECIDYALYIKKGYDIGSGAIESANKNVLQKRLDGPGMRWYIESAQNLVTLRAKMESDRWYDDVVTVVNKFYNIN